MVGYSHDICATTVLICKSSQAGCYCSWQSSLLNKIDDYLIFTMKFC